MIFHEISSKSMHKRPTNKAFAPSTITSARDTLITVLVWCSSAAVTTVTMLA